MTEQNKLQPAELKDQLAEITETMQRERVEFSPEIQKYFDEEMARFTELMANGQMPIKKDLDEFIGKIKLYVENEKFIQRDMSKSYDEMVYTLNSYGYKDKRPDKETVLNAIRELGPEMIQNIRGFIWPKIIMTPKVTLASMKAKIDNNKKFPDQKDVFFQETPLSELWGNQPDAFTVSVVEGAITLPQLPSDIRNLTLGEKYQYLYEDYKKRGMKMISTREYMMLLQQFLPTYRFSKNKINVLDFYDATILNCDHLKEIEMIPYGFWHPEDEKYKLLRDPPQTQEESFNSRPSVKVMEI